MKSKNKDTGRHGEELAVEYLKKKGLKILHTNWQIHNQGEIDIIAEQRNTLVFIEVKTRSSLDFGNPLEAIDNKKLEQMKKTALLFLSQNKKHYDNIRFDAVSILLKPEIKIYHLENIV